MSVNSVSENSTSLQRLNEAFNSELSVIRDAKLVYKSQYPVGREVEYLSVDELDYRPLIRAASKDGSNIDSVKFALNKRIRTDVATVITAARSYAHDRLISIKDNYLEKLRGYRGRYPVTSSAKSEGELVDIISGLNSIPHINTSSEEFLHLTYDAWKSLVKTQKVQIEEINKVTADLSEDILKWEKYIDEKRRIHYALWGILIAILFKGAEVVLQLLESSPAYVYDCKFDKAGQHCSLESSR